MPAGKRKDRETDQLKLNRIEVNNDHESFLQAFEKPTQIYRYLRTRNMISPIFLNRNLSYMKKRLSRNNTNRSTFQIDNILMDKIKLQEKKCGLLNDYMSLIFISFLDKSFPTDAKNFVQVEIILLKISHKKRKDNVSDMSHTIIGQLFLGVNNLTMSNLKFPVANIGIDLFNPLEDLSRSYMLLFKVQTIPQTVNRYDDLIDTIKKSNTKVFASELLIFDKFGKCLLTEGEYMVTLDEIHNIRLPQNKQAKWETIPESTVSSIQSILNPLESFEKKPMLKFRLIWSKKSLPLLLNSLIPFNEQYRNQEDDIKKIQQIENGFEKKEEIVYQFIYNHKYRQQTEATTEFVCPWCSLNCQDLYPLLKHLKLCHDRFTFIYVLANGINYINVSINNMHDGSYTGSPYDIIGQSGFTFSRIGPIRRVIVTHLLVCHPRRTKPMLSEFVEIDETEMNNQRPFLIGHNRLYHHTMTYMPVHPKELDMDSEAENDPAWLQKKTLMMIDDFTDVNDGEKELMKMWNLHIMKYVFVGDCQIPIACDMFIDKRGRELLEKKLYRNFLLHMCSMCDFGLLSPEDFYTVMQRFQKILTEYPEARQSLTEQFSEQMSYWISVGMYKPQTQHEPILGYCKRGRTNI